MSFKQFIIDELHKLIVEKNEEIKILKNKLVQIESNNQMRFMDSYCCDLGGDDYFRDAYDSPNHPRKNQ